MDKNMYSNKWFYTPQDLRNILRMRWSQHIMWTRSYIISAISKLDDIEVVLNRLLENPRDLSNILRIYYGDKIANEFNDLSRKHIILATDLVTSYIEGNPASTTEIERNWYENANQLATYLSSINPYWDIKTLQNLFYNQLEMTKDEILKRLTRQYAADVYHYEFIEYHALMIADIMANGIIKQFYH